MKTCCIYVRVSTKQQSVAGQLQELRAYAKRRRLRILGEFADEGVSGGKESRPGLLGLMMAARRKSCDAVLVSRFDRFARSSMHLAQALAEFQSLGIEFISLAESVDTSTPTGKMVFSVLAAVAELERAIIRERVSAGVTRARRTKEHWGRPRKVFDRERARKMAAAGVSNREIGQRLGVSKDTIRKAIAERK